MPFNQPDSIKYYYSDLLAEENIIHAVFTRRGGLSPEPWASLNVGGLRGDDPQRVYQNRVLSFTTMGREPESVYDVWQVHSSDVLCTDGPRPQTVRHRKADAILTDRPEVTLFMRFGDCVPILLYEPNRRVIGIIHAGWIGTVKGIVTETITTMQTEYRCDSADIRAVIGPSIAAHHYEVGTEVAEQVERAFDKDADALLIIEGGSTYFDLWRANQLLLEKWGVREIEVSGICTACELDDWYSHRGESGRTGRFGVLMALKDE